MIDSWVFFWFFAVLIYVIGKALKKQKIANIPLIYYTNSIAILLGGYATYLMLAGS